jgi:pimeloyl-ACP methyl ester carboxylesterase
MDSLEFRTRQVDVDGSSLHVVEAGDPDARPVLFLHGWPESWQSWRPVMALAAPDVRAIAIDLPGIGASGPAPTGGSKRKLAAVVHRLVETLDLDDLTLVGHDAGGMVVYACLRQQHADLGRAVIMDVVTPGLDPWEDVRRNPYVWHFGMHAVPGLAEMLVQGHQADYFDYFYRAISAQPERITPELRAAHAAAYATDGQLTAGFEWYRAFTQDAEDNRAGDPPTDTPLLYLRGDHESGDIATYVKSFGEAGVRSVRHGIVPESGHFAPEESPEAVWREISRFMSDTT